MYVISIIQEQTRSRKSKVAVWSSTSTMLSTNLAPGLV